MDLRKTCKCGTVVTLTCNAPPPEVRKVSEFTVCAKCLSKVQFDEHDRIR